MRFLFIGVILLCSYADLFATHLRCGQILVRQNELGGRTVTIKVEYYTNTEGTSVLFGGEEDVLDFGDGSSMLIPERPNNVMPHFPPHVGYAFFEVEHTYAGYGYYLVSYREPNRNEGILNIDHSVNTPAYIETKFRLAADMAYESPRSLLPPIFQAFTYNQFSSSLAATSSSADSISYHPTTPLQARHTFVENFRDIGVEMNAITGDLVWNTSAEFIGAPLPGEYLIAAKVVTWNVIGGKWVVTGYVLRDYQILVEEAEELNTLTDDQETNVFYPEETYPKVIEVYATHDAETSVAFDVESDLPESDYSIETFESANDTTLLTVAKITVLSNEASEKLGAYSLVARATYDHPDFANEIKDVTFAFITRYSGLGAIMNTTETGKAQFSLTPNPFSSEVKLPGYEAPCTLLVYNILGQKVAAIRKSAGGFFDTNALQPGVYVMRAVKDNGSVVSASRMIKR
jgi:hypothetical protein